MTFFRRAQWIFGLHDMINIKIATGEMAICRTVNRALVFDTEKKNLSPLIQGIKMKKKTVGSVNLSKG